MKNRKGFTLLEILAVIVIIAILASLVIPSIIRNVKKGKDEYNFALENELLSIAKDYYSSHLEELPTGLIANDGKASFIKILWLSNLASNNYLNTELVDADGNSCNNSYVLVEKVEKQRKYNYIACLLCGSKGYETTNDYCSFVNISDDSVPTCIAELKSTPNENGWLNKNIKIEFIGGANKDAALFKIGNKTYIPANNVVTYETDKSIEGSLTGFVFNKAGISGSCSLDVNIKVDKEKPTGKITLSTINGASFKATLSDLNDGSGSGVATNYEFAISKDSKCTSATYTSATTLEKNFGSSYDRNVLYYACAKVKDNAGNEEILYSNGAILPKTKAIILSNLNILTGNSFNTNYDYQSASEKKVTLPLTMEYILQAWGAQGGPSNTAIQSTSWLAYLTGGYGAFTTGTKVLNANTDVYINIGGRGGYSSGKNVGYSGSCSSVFEYAGGYNGGGTYRSCYAVGNGGGAGGGATSIATSSGTIYNLGNTLGVTEASKKLLIVAAGGGGGAWTYKTSFSGNTCNSNYSSYVSSDGGWCASFGGDGGGNVGISGSPNTECQSVGGKQTSDWGNICGSTTMFGYGKPTIINDDNYTYGGAGGGGYYGGGASVGTHAIPGGGAGGSSYIKNLDLTNGKAYTSCYKCSVNNDASVKTISTKNSSVDPIVDSAKRNNGYARITASNGQNGFYSGTIYYKTIEFVNATNSFTISGEIDSNNIVCDNNSSFNIIKNGDGTTSVTISSNGTNDICRIYK